MNDAGAMLLVRRRDNGMWAMPGGALEVGETPAEGVVREAYEETGVRCQPLTLVGVFDSRRCGSTNRYHLYHFVFVCKPIGTVRFSEASHAHESIEVKWFTEDNLPDDIDPGHASRIPEAFRVWRSNCPAFFDQ
jgi:ADP-ribose pyrophosphatase YjhB (NUDIX family)